MSVERIWTAKEIADGFHNLRAGQDMSSLERFTALVTENTRRVVHETTPFDLYGDGIGEVAFIDQMGNDKRVVQMGRTSFGRHFDDPKEEDVVRLLNTFQREHHDSPSGHTAFSFADEVPLFLVPQHLRHTVFVSHQQESARYRQLRPRFYVPRQFRVQDAKNKQHSVVSDQLDNGALRTRFLDQCLRDYEEYKWLLSQGVAREIARAKLPSAIYTTLVATFNMRSLLHFLTLRLDPHAQYEIQRVAEAYLHFAEPYYPVLFDRWREHVLAPLQEKWSAS